VNYRSADLRSPIPLTTSRSRDRLWTNTAVYLAGCFGTVLACYATIVCGLLFLRATDNLPPPIVANSLCLDEKLQWIGRDLPSSPPDLLVFGSSVAWRHFDGQKAVELGLAKDPYNLGFCGMNLGQTAFIVKYFLSKYNFRSPLRVIVIASPQDFEGCTSPEQPAFPTREADEAIFSSMGRLALYLKNIDFVPLVRNALIVKAMRRGVNALDSLMFTRSGDGPLDTDESRGLTYGRINKFNQDCFSALRNIATQLSDQRVQFVLVLTPINPRWISEYDSHHSTLNELRSRIAATLKGTNARIWDASESKLFSEPDFPDAIHLRWSAAGRLTAAIADFVRNSAE
jgi:hypothetical protein